MSLSGDILTSSLSAGLRQAVERRRRTLVSVTVESDVADPCAAVFASRLASDRWFCWEQPDRGFALAGLGVAHEAASRGATRFADVAEECLRTGGDAVVEEPPGLPAGAGPVWLGGFAFDRRRWRLLDLVLALARLAGPARALALPQRRARLPHRQRGGAARGRPGGEGRCAGRPAHRTAWRGAAAAARPAPDRARRRSAAPGRPVSSRRRSPRRPSGSGRGR